MENNSHRKDIALWLDMPILTQSNDLRSYVTWSSTSVEKIFLIISVTSQSKVDYHRIKRKRISQHYVLRF